MKIRVSFIVFFLFLWIFSFCQSKNWVGGTGDWNVASNWNPTGVPTSTDDVTVYSGDVTISTVASAKSLVIGNAIFTIASAGALTIDGAAYYGLRNNGGTVVNNGVIAVLNSTRNGILNQGGNSFTNNGDITISGTTGFYHGIQNQATFDNAGTLSIDNTSNADGINNFPGTSFTNSGTINIATSLTIGYNGIQNQGAFDNTSTGIIQIGTAGGTGTNRSGLLNVSGATFTSAGTINIDKAGMSASFVALDNKGTFTLTGSINIGSEVFSGIKNTSTFTASPSSSIIIGMLSNTPILNSMGTMTMDGMIEIEGNTVANTPGINNMAQFDVNDFNATIIVKGSAGPAISNKGDATFNNSGTIVIGSNSNIATNGIETFGTFNNNFGQITIGNTSDQLGGRGILVLSSGSFNNKGPISIDNTTTFPGIDNQGTFTNDVESNITIGTNALVNHRGINNAGNFVNQGYSSIVIDMIKYEGIYCNDSSTFTNNPGSVKINGGGYASMWAITGTGTGIFDNGPLGILFCKEDIVGNYFTNSGEINPGNSPGLLNIRNIYNTTGTPKYVAELGGTTVDTEYDRMHFYNGGAGNFDISNSDLIVYLINGFNPSVGDAFDVLTSQFGFTGQFANATLPVPPPNTQWIMDYTTDPNRLTLRLESTLPVEWGEFSGYAKGNNILLEWTTISEENVDGYEVQRSLDNIHWEPLGWVNAKENAHVKNIYRFIDESPESNENYYRLNQVDIDGKSNISKVVKVDFNESENIYFYPNPAKNKIYFTQDVDRATLLGMDGRLLQSWKKAKNSFMDIQYFPKGIYILQITGRFGFVTKQLIVE